MNRSDSLSALMELLRFATISAAPGDGTPFRQCAVWLARHMLRMGLSADVIATGGQPIAIGEWRKQGGRPTVLIYGHYDVQPVDPLNEWVTPPFQPTLRGANLYARGASDDKGQLFVHLEAADRWLQSAGELPVNVVFLFEGEEEIGSPNLASFVDRHRDRLAADVAVISDTRMLGPDRPAITYALRGSLGMEIDVAGQAADLHSGNFGGAVYNPLQGLCEILARLHDSSGRAAIPAFYDRVRETPAREREHLARTGPSDREVLAAAGAALPWGEPGFTAYERTTIRPAIVITGMGGGYQGPGTKAVLPAHARAQLNIRLAPDQQPEDIDALLRRYVASIAPPGLAVRISTHRSTPPVVVDVRHPAMRAAVAACEHGFGQKPAFVRSGGTIPAVDIFRRILGLPTILMGFALPDDGLHGPNEKLHVPTFFKAVATSRRFLAEVRRIGAAAPARPIAS